MSSTTTQARPPTFFDLYRRGEVSAEQIDDFVDRWHAGSDAWARKTPLSEYLGLTNAEYEAWVRDPDALPAIRAARPS